MGLWTEFRRRSVPALTPAICACAIAYFGYHALEGERGLQTYRRLNAAIAESRATLAETTAERRRLEQRVALLRADGLDLDMIDELARGTLGLVRPDELVILKSK
jgi:cell division protein FtsB